MKRLIILMILCTLINGCGLFKNTKKDVLVSKSGASVEKREESELKVQDKSNSVEVTTSVKTNDKLKRTSLQADRVTFNSNGSFNAEGNVKLDVEESEKIRQLDSAFKKLKSDIDYYFLAEAASKEKQSTYEKETHKESTPSGKAIIYGAIGLLIIWLGILRHLWIKGRKLCRKEKE